MPVRTKRVYESPDSQDGTRVLVDRPEQIRELLEHARSGTLTLLYAATDEEHNNAVVLEDYLADRLVEG